jgi:hypothetical protein
MPTVTELKLDSVQADYLAPLCLGANLWSHVSYCVLPQHAKQAEFAELKKFFGRDSRRKQVAVAAALLNWLSETKPGKQLAPPTEAAVLQGWLRQNTDALDDIQNHQSGRGGRAMELVPCPWCRANGQPANATVAEPPHPREWGTCMHTAQEKALALCGILPVDELVLRELEAFEDRIFMEVQANPTELFRRKLKHPDRDAAREVLSTDEFRNSMLGAAFLTGKNSLTKVLNNFSPLNNPPSVHEFNSHLLKQETPNPFRQPVRNSLIAIKAAQKPLDDDQQRELAHNYNLRQYHQTHQAANAMENAETLAAILSKPAALAIQNGTSAEDAKIFAHYANFFQRENRILRDLEELRNEAVQDTCNTFNIQREQFAVILRQVKQGPG